MIEPSGLSNSTSVISFSKKPSAKSLTIGSAFSNKANIEFHSPLYHLNPDMLIVTVNAAALISGHVSG